jgi:hypothetical protein
MSSILGADLDTMCPKPAYTMSFMSLDHRGHPIAGIVLVPKVLLAISGMEERIAYEYHTKYNS